MKKEKAQKRTPETLKRRLVSATAMLLVAAIMLMTTTYAWLVLSVAPEVSGITTNIGANGSLEIALLSKETRENLYSIKDFASSLQGGSEEANKSWGNLVDLSYSSYGLSEIVLLPSRLQVLDYATPSDSYKVASGLLSVPTYGYDGRIISLDDSPLSAVYKDGKFVYIEQEYGVRAIGTSSSGNIFSSTLSMAQSNVKSYKNNANSEAKNALEKNGEALFDIMADHKLNPDAGYTQSDIDSIKALISGLTKSVFYIDSAYREAMVAYVAVSTTDEEKLKTAKTVITSTSITLTELLGNDALKDYKEKIPSDISDNFRKVDKMNNDLRAAAAKCEALEGDRFTWEQISPILDYIMKTDKVMIGEKYFTEATSAYILGLGDEIELTLAPDSGIPADIADFAGDFDTFVRYFVKNIHITTETTQEPVYLDAVSAKVEELEIPSDAETSESSAETSGEKELTELFAYAIDLAFRTNASNADLLLETDATQRVYTDSTATATQGGGSYMEFSTDDPEFTLDKMLELMDGIRVGFIGADNSILCIAKPNISNRTSENGIVKAPLYLYDYSFDAENGAIIIGERKKEEPKIVSLEQNSPKAVTVVVWLDGDEIDNSKVSATQSMSLSGTLNLQFCTNVDLVPAGNNSLMYNNTDKKALAALVEEYKATYEAGQGMYTTDSWSKFAAAYENAVAVNENAAATPAQVAIANTALSAAKEALAEADDKTLKAKIAEIREKTGTAEGNAMLAYLDGNELCIADLLDITQATYDRFIKKNAKEIKAVDYNNNFNDLDGTKTLKYTESSWRRLAYALYNAEAVSLTGMNSAAKIDEVITALADADAALTPDVYYRAYELNDTLYYKVISEDKDTYGQWFDSDFTKVISDKKILDLDAKSSPAKTAYIDENDYISYDVTDFITPTIKLNGNIYKDLLDQSIIAAEWKVADDYFDMFISDSEMATLTDLVADAKNLIVKLGGDPAEEPSEGETSTEEPPAEEPPKEETAAEKLIKSLQSALKFANGIDLENGYASEAKEAISMLQSAVNAANKYLNIPDFGGYITDDQITVLNAAIAGAKSVNGFVNTQNYDPLDGGKKPDEKLVTLVEKTESAEALLAKIIHEEAEDGTTYIDRHEVTEEAAAKALDELNAALKDLNEEEITANNVLKIDVSGTSETVFEVMNRVIYPSIKLKIKEGAIGDTVINATIVTERGVIYSMSKTVTLYAKAEGVNIFSSSAPAGGELVDIATFDNEGKEITLERWNGVMELGSRTKLSAELLAFVNPAYAEQPETTEPSEGETTEPSEGETTEPENKGPYWLPMTETIKTYSWSSANAEIVTVTNADSKECKIEGVKEGTAKIILKVTTYEGNTYVAEFEVSVVEHVEPEEPEVPEEPESPEEPEEPENPEEP